MNKRLLKQQGFSELAIQFSLFIQRLNKTENDILALTAALLSDAVSQGHVCLNLANSASFQTQDISQLETIPTSKEQWVQALRQSHIVARAGEIAPLILTDEGLLYLYRYYEDECFVAKAIKQRCQPIDNVELTPLKIEFDQWQSRADDIDWQKVAVLMALSRQFCVISGGPGTGKTTIVLRLLQMLQTQSTHLKVALAAPTGKAAARLQHVVSEQEYSESTNTINITAKTIHRLLGITPDNDRGRYNALRPLNVDVVIIDEASMIDISLMAKLLKALPGKARLILLGDSGQLASVEAGAVLSSLCHKVVAYSETFNQLTQQVLEIELDNDSESNTLLTDSVVILEQSYRFDTGSDINQLAMAVQSGDVGAVYNVIDHAQSPLWLQSLESTVIQHHVTNAYMAYFKVIKGKGTAAECLHVFEHYRVLCALKSGPHSVSSVNELIEKQLYQQGWKTHDDFYHGRPIMVTRNDYQQKLFNGDVGLILYDEHGVLRAFFKDEQGLRWINLSRLPAHETVFAMTVHKSQGSEFEHVSVLLPEEESPLLSRELLYTAITRAKKSVTVIASDMILSKTVATQYQRETGLGYLLE